MPPTSKPERMTCSASIVLALSERVDLGAEAHRDLARRLVEKAGVGFALLRRDEMQRVDEAERGNHGAAPSVDGHRLRRQAIGRLAGRGRYAFLADSRE